MTHSRLRWCAFLALSLTIPACEREAAQGGRPLPAAATSLQARDSIAFPFDEIAPGVFSRVVYRTPASGGATVEVRDLELAQGKSIASLTFPGAAVIEIRGGKGTSGQATKTQDIQAGSTLGLSQGDSLRLDNKEAGPLSLRVYVIGSR